MMVSPPMDISFKDTHTHKTEKEKKNGIDWLISLCFSLPPPVYFIQLLQSFRTLIVIASLAYVHGAVVRRSFGSSYGAAPVSSYGAPAAPAPAPAAAPASAPAPSYGSYGAPAVSYGIPAAQSYGPIFYLEEDRVWSITFIFIQVATEIKSL